MNQQAVPGLAEPYSHLDSVDVAAAVGAAHDAYSDLGPVVRLVNPKEGATISSLFAALLGAVAALGAPGTVADGAIPTASWRAVAQDDDAVAAALASLGPTLAGYGPRQITVRNP